MEPWYETKYRIHKFIDNLIHPFRVFWYTTRNFFYWGWFLRDDRNWDYYFLYVILEKKLSLMRKCINNGWIEKEEKDKIFAPLDRAIQLCKRLKDQDYSENQDKVEEKWGSSKMAFNPSNHPNLSRAHFWNKNAIYPHEQDQANMDFIQASRLDDEAQKNDREEFFKILADNIERWWD